MGIKDLLKFMKPYIQSININKYAGKRVGIDAYSWLHKGAYSCSMELCLNSDSDKKLQYVNYFMHRINLLRHSKITPVVVFDGGNIPCKAATEQERNRRRNANRDLAMKKLKEGDISAASELFQRAVSVTPAMAHQLIKTLKSENVEFVVAPYEADAQLAYLSSIEAEKGGIEAVITEDSDLMAYGCQAIIFKMDRYGNGEAINLDKVFDSASRTPSFQNFDKELFTGMCVLAGCDFLPSVPGIGIVKAYSLVSKYRNLDRVLSVLKFEKGNQMPGDYANSFREALAVFQHARIYDSEIKKLKHLKPLPQELLQSLNGELDFLGPDIPPSIACAIAQGNLDPTSMEAFDHFPCSKSHPSPIVLQTSGQLKRSKAVVVAAQESRCFKVYSSPKTREKDTEMKHNLVSNGRKYLKEAAALAKLLPPSDIQERVEKMSPNDAALLKIPDNNPFKKIKIDEIQPEQIEGIANKDSVEYMDILCLSPDSIPLEVSDSSPSKKRKLDELCSVQMESIELENSDIICMTLDSQESVDSKPKKMSNRRVMRGKIEKNLKKSNCRSSEKKKSSILNFFSPL